MPGNLMKALCGLICLRTFLSCCVPLQEGEPDCCLCMQCVQKCCEKFMKHSARVGMRFAELSSQAEQQMQQLLQQQAGK